MSCSARCSACAGPMTTRPTISSSILPTTTNLTAPHVHWRLRIAPDLTTWGGFELGAGMPINAASPEADAARLRLAEAEAAP